MSPAGSSPWKKVLSVIGVASFPAQISFGGVVVDAPMQRVVEMLLLEEARHPVAGLVVDQDRAEKGLLRLEIMGRGTEGRRLAQPAVVGEISACS